MCGIQIWCDISLEKQHEQAMLVAAIWLLRALFVAKYYCIMWTQIKYEKN